MSMKKVILGGLVVALLGPSAAFAQGPGSMQPGPSALPASAQDPTGANGFVGEVRAPLGPSPWVVGTSPPDCCGPLTDHNPLKTELYFRGGWVLPFGDGALAHSLEAGWGLEGGGRTLFFNDPGDAAWVIDVGASNFYNHANNSPATVSLLNIRVPDVTGNLTTVPQLTATIHSLNRTYVNAGFGREWYLLGGAAGTRDTPCPAKWRAGVDVGGRWGTEKAQFVEIRHLTDTIGAAYVAAHTDVDLSCGCCVFQVGFRMEYDYTWSDVLQIQNKSDVQSINLLVNLGVRY